MPHVVITGASRGIGLGLARAYAADGWRVTATVRTATTAPGDGIDVRVLDVAAPETFASFAAAVAEPIDVLINNAGIYGRRPQRVADVDPEAWLDIFRVNTVGPLLLTRALLPHMRHGGHGGHGKLVTITSRMGSLAENHDGSAPMYRASKAAVNIAMQCLGLELHGRGCGVLLIHPGWVRTDMGTGAASLDVDESVAGIRRVIDAYAPAEGVVFRAWDGRAIPW